ncbi:MAG: hypothetical protein WCO86_00230 [Planctomycetota bacterium]
MSFTISAFNHDEWNRCSLADFSDFADQIAEVNVSEDAFSGNGDWYFIPNEPLPNNDRVIYFGSWGNDNSPGASAYTNAEIFDALDPDQLIEFSKRLDHWEIAVRRESDGIKGSLYFQHGPRFYYSFEPH